MGSCVEASCRPTCADLKNGVAVEQLNVALQSSLISILESTLRLLGHRAGCFLAAEGGISGCTRLVSSAAIGIPLSPKCSDWKQFLLDRREWFSIPAGSGGRACCPVDGSNRDLPGSKDFVALRMSLDGPVHVFMLLEPARDKGLDFGSLPLMCECRSRLQAALDSYDMCVNAARRGHHIAFVGASEPFLELGNRIRSVAAYSEWPVLIKGERGTGKEAAAYAIHHYSARRNGPFVIVNSAALHPELYGVELFGCRKGAFTGAIENRIGRFEAANGGTLFFDEITEMPRALFAGLLRAVENGEVQKIGENQPSTVDVRVIAATNRDIEKLVDEGLFPADLYDRISVLQIDVPPLRERKSDIPLLVSYFLRKYCPQSAAMHEQDPCRDCYGRSRVRCLDSRTLEKLIDCDWPGNVRELQNTVVRLRAESSADRISAMQLPFRHRISPAPPEESSGDLTLDSILRRHILAILERAGWNKSAAARTLGIPLSTLVSKMKRLGLPKNRGRQEKFCSFTLGAYMPFCSMLSFIC